VGAGRRGESARFTTRENWDWCVCLCVCARAREEGGEGGVDVMGDVCTPNGAQTEHALREVCAQRGWASAERAEEAVVVVINVRPLGRVVE